jgi:hypothetical protein
MKEPFDIILLANEAALQLLEKQNGKFDPDTKDAFNCTKVVHSEFLGKDDWPDEIIFKKEDRIIFAKRQSFKGKKSNLFAAHRDDGPAIIGKSALHWYQNGVSHRDDGPAYIWESLAGNYGCEYCVNGKWHRTDGPAISTYSYYFKREKHLFIEKHELRKIEVIQ